MQSFTDEHVENYLYAMLPPRDATLQEMERQAKRARHSHRRPRRGPPVLPVREADPGQDRLRDGLGHRLLHHRWAKAVGVGGKVHYTDGSRKNADEARRFFDQAGVAERIEVHVGDALELLSERKEQFDILFSDVDKHDYPQCSTWRRRVCAKAACSSPTTLYGAAR